MNYSQTMTPGADKLIVISEPHKVADSTRLRLVLPKDLAMIRYSIHDRRLLRRRLDGPISTQLRVHANGIYVTEVSDRYQTEMAIGGAGLPRYWFAFANTGTMVVDQGGSSVTAGQDVGIALLGRPETHLLSSDGSLRTNVWIDAAVLERALSAMLGDSLRRPLEFRMAVDWGRGLAFSLRQQIKYFASELRRRDGLVSNPTALACLTDLILQTLLLALPHNHSDRLARPKAELAPGLLIRAEDYMRAHAGQPIRMEQVAAAAGGSIRALNAAYRRYRDTTPLSALRSIRLANVRAELLQSGEASIGEIAARHGFTNVGRFARAYSELFGELPSRTLIRR